MAGHAARLGCRGGRADEQGAVMNTHVATALASPVFDPERQIDARFFWYANHGLSVGLTVNIGME
jgi:hypothetical protein